MVVLRWTASVPPDSTLDVPGGTKLMGEAMSSACEASTWNKDTGDGGTPHEPLRLECVRAAGVEGEPCSTDPPDVHRLGSSPFIATGL